MEVEYIKGRHPGEIRAYEIPIGTVFAGRLGTNRSKLFLKCFEVIVDLENPDSTWQDRDMVVEQYVILKAKLLITE